MLTPLWYVLDFLSSFGAEGEESSRTVCSARCVSHS
jgi:hypothetical protein